LPVILPTSR